MPVLEEEMVGGEEKGAEHCESYSEKHSRGWNISVRPDYDWSIAGANCAHKTSLENKDNALLSSSNSKIKS